MIPLDVQVEMLHWQVGRMSLREKLGQEMLPREHRDVPSVSHEAGDHLINVARKGKRAMTPGHSDTGDQGGEEEIARGRSGL